MTDHPSRPAPPQGHGSDRRQWKRVPADSLTGLRAELSGDEVTLLDISRGGVRFQSPTRMLPGLNVSLCFITSDGEITVRGEIGRSTMVQLPIGTMVYQVGVSFDELLSGPLAEATAQAEPKATAGRRAADRTPAPTVSVTASVTQSVEQLVELIGQGPDEAG